MKMGGDAEWFQRNIWTISSGIPPKRPRRNLRRNCSGPLVFRRKYGNPIMHRDEKTILLVEDNEDNRLIYVAALQFAGYRVLEAVTGAEGIRLARVEQPDLILMDISIPDLDGWEAATILKADPTTRHIPIVAVTAHALPGDE